MLAATSTDEEIVQHAQEVYERQIRAHVEDTHRGEFLALDVQTGDYEVGSDELRTMDRLKARHPEGLCYLLRVGAPTAVKLGGSFRQAR